jgi:hypothetical protein
MLAIISYVLTASTATSVTTWASVSAWSMVSATVMFTTLKTASVIISGPKIISSMVKIIPAMIVAIDYITARAAIVTTMNNYWSAVIITHILRTIVIMS